MITAVGTEPLGAPGVVAVLTARGAADRGEGKGRLYEPLARDEVVYAGQPVAIVVAETEAIASDAVDLVELDSNRSSRSRTSSSPCSRARQRPVFVRPTEADLTSATPMPQCPPAGLTGVEFRKMSLTRPTWLTGMSTLHWPRAMW